MCHDQGMLQVCLNGARTRSRGDHVPVSPAELAESARAAVAVGAVDVHLHPKDDEGADTLVPAYVDAAVGAVRAAVPGVPVGVTTGEWAEPDPARRERLIRAWSVRPDHASVNWHEEGAESVAELLLSLGIGVEVGQYSGAGAVERFLAWPHAGRVTRVLAEVTDTDPVTAPATAAELVAELGGFALAPILLHGEGTAAWTVLQMAAHRGLDTRMGLEDTLMLPNGVAASGNAELIHAAREMIKNSDSKIRGGLGCRRGDPPA